MILQLFEHIGQILQNAGLGLSEDHLTVGGSAKKMPSVALALGQWELKVPTLSPLHQEAKRLNQTEVFTIPSSRATKKGPYPLSYIPEALTGIFVLEDPGEDDEQLSQLASGDYSLQTKDLSLTKEYKGGTQLQVNYTLTGLEHKDRFQQAFTLVVTDKAAQAVRLEKTASLILPALWAQLDTLKEASYAFSQGNLAAQYQVGELSFLKQSLTAAEDHLEISLDFSLQGMVTYRKVFGDGLHQIEQVKLGEQSATLDPQGGFSIQVGKP